MPPESDEPKPYFEPEIGTGGRLLITACWCIVLFVVLSNAIDDLLRILKSAFS